MGSAGKNGLTVSFECPDCVAAYLSSGQEDLTKCLWEEALQLELLQSKHQVFEPKCKKGHYLLDGKLLFTNKLLEMPWIFF